MRQQVVTLSAAGASQWLFTDPRRFLSFQAGLVVTLDSTANLTYDVDLTLDANSQERHQTISIARVTTTATVTLVDHGLAVGDNITVFNTGESNLDGSHDVATVVDDDSFTYTVADTGAASAEGKLISFRIFKHPTLQGLTIGQAGSQDSPATAVRLNITSYTAGKATLTVLQQG